MKTLSIGQIVDHFKDKFKVSELDDDIELQFIWQRLSEKVSTYGIHWNYQPQGEMLKLFQTHLPELFPTE